MKVSVILTSYNYAQYLKDTINSVLNQKYNDWEMIIIDDGSVDNSVEIIMEYANSDSRIKLIRNYENQGLAKSIQIGLLAASGDWVAFLESDDLWKEDYLQKKLEIADKYPNSGLIYNGVEFFGENAVQAMERFAGIVKKNNSKKFPQNMFYSFGYENPLLTMSSVMVKRDLLESVDFNSPIDKLFDWYLYIQIAAKTDFYYLAAPLTLWRQHAQSYVSRKGHIKFKFANISAYGLILKKNPWNIKLLIFIIISTILMCFKRVKFYLKTRISIS